MSSKIPIVPSQSRRRTINLSDREISEIGCHKVGWKEKYDWYRWEFRRCMHLKASILQSSHFHSISLRALKSMDSRLVERQSNAENRSLAHDGKGSGNMTIWQYPGSMIMSSLASWQPLQTASREFISREVETLKNEELPCRSHSLRLLLDFLQSSDGVEGSWHL